MGKALRLAELGIKICCFPFVGEDPKEDSKQNDYAEDAGPQTWGRGRIYPEAQGRGLTI